MLKRISLLALLITVSTSVFAQYDHPRKKEHVQSSEREGRWEGSVILAYQNGLTQSNEGGSKIDVDSSTGWGLSAAWNWTGNWNLSYRFLSIQPNYTATIVPEDSDQTAQVLDHKLTKNSHQFNVTYNFSRKAFTPFLVAGVGYSKVDTNVPNAPPSIGCWWDPWWGYICVSDWETYKTSGFSYNFGAGLRWDINDSIFTKAAYSRQYIDVKNGSTEFDMAILELGLMF
jgi:opacity protein-like surface antigen